MHGVPRRPRLAKKVTGFKKVICAACLLNGLLWGQSKTICLDNGLRIAFQEKTGPPLAAIVLAVDIGAKDGEDAAGGQVHLLEHLLLFGGSSQRPLAGKIAAIRRLGAQFNAHTDHDLMTFEIVLPVTELASGLQILKETVFENHFSEAELQQEKRIIGTEIAQIQDDPWRLGPTVVLQELFAGHPYARPLSGTEAAVSAVSAETIRTLYRRHFSAGNSALAVVGPLDSRQAEAHVRAIFAAVPGGEPLQRSLPPLPPLKKNRVLARQLDIEQSHLFFAFRAPGYNHPDRQILNVLNQILGGGLNPMLSGIFRNGQRVVDGLDLKYFALAQGGALVIHLITAPANGQYLKNQLSKRLGRLPAFCFSKSDFPGAQQFAALDFLEGARNQLRWSGEAFKEASLNMASSIARYLLLHKESAAGEPAVKEIEAISSNDLRRIGDRYLSGEKFVCLTIAPMGTGQ
jgi:predicted Zn-dependent peptidase